MKEITEQYGTGFLHLIAGIAAMAVIMSCIREGGVISTAVSAFLQGICG